MMKTNHRIKFTVLLALTAVLITGCGFHLRGNVTFSPKILQHSFFVDSSDPDFVDAFQQALISNKATISDTREGAILLKLTHIKFSQNVQTTDPYGLATRYQLNYVVEYQLTDAQGKELKPITIVTQNRIINYRTDQQLQIEEESQFLKRDMRNEIIIQILRQLSKI